MAKEKAGEIERTSSKKSHPGRSLLGLGLVLGLGWLRVRASLRQLTLQKLALMPRVIGPRNPRDLGMEYEEVWFTARDGVKLHGWYIPDPPGGGETKNVTVIMGHGHAGNKEPDLEYAAFFYQAGYNVFMFDFRGHGRSEGPLGSSLGWAERYDVHGAVDFLLGRGQSRFAAFGISMGAAILIMAAAENPFIRAVIADSAYAHLYRSIAAEINNAYHLPMWFSRPVGYYGWQFLAVHHGFSPRSSSPADYVARIAPRPLLLIHGGEDTLTRVENAHILFKLAGQPKELWIEPGVAHAQSFVSYGRAYEERVLDFLARVDWQAPLTFEAPSHTLEGLPVS